MPADIAPGEEVIATLEFVPRFPEFQREVEVYVEDPDGVRTITLTVKSAPREARHDTPSPTQPAAARRDPD